MCKRNWQEEANSCSLANLGKMQFNAPDFAHDLLWIENIDSSIFVKTKNNCQQVIQEIVSKYMNMKVFHTKIALKLGGFIAKIPTRQWMTSIFRSWIIF